MTPPPSRAPEEGGAVTAEFAVALPGIVLVCVALLVTGQAMIGEIRCTDAARAGARLAARGEPLPAVVAEARRRSPPGAAVGVSRSATEVRVVVRAPLSLPAAGWTGLAVSGSATASAEAVP